jgi:hypothetical protein
MTSADEILKDECTDQVKDILASLSGDGDRKEARITQWTEFHTSYIAGDSRECILINSIYHELEKSEKKTVMQY